LAIGGNAVADGARRTILLVEDEGIIALSEKQLLENYGYAVVVAPSGEAAVGLFDGNPDIDLILMDIDLGKGMDGTEAAQAILGLRDLPIVFLSSHSEPEIVERTEKITSYGYILKHSSVTVLDASIKMAFKLFEANQRTRKAMNKLAATLDAIPDQFFELTLDGKYLDYHSRDEDLLYASPSGFLGKKVNEVLPPRAAEVVMASIREAHEFGVSSGREYELAVPAGQRCFEASASRLAGEGGEPRFILICRDITEHKRLEGGIRTSNELFQAVLDAIPQYICWKDRSSVFLGCNKRHAELFGLPDTKAIIGKTDWDLHRDRAEIESFIRDDREVMEADAPRYNIVESAHYPDGKARWNETSKVPLHSGGGEVSGVMIAYADITERLEAERKWKEGRDLYEAILRATPEGISVVSPSGETLMVSVRKSADRAVDQEKNLLKVLLETSSDHIYFKDLRSRFIMNSRAHARYMGVEDPADLFGKTDFDFFTEAHAGQAYRDEQEIIRTGKAIKKEETNIKSSGPDTWVLTEKMPLRDESGAIVGTFGISRDITERKLGEERIKSLLEEKELILKEVHHRIKNNMSVIQGLLSLQASSVVEPGAVKALNDAESRIESMVVLYEQLYQGSEFSDVPANVYLDSLIDRMLANSANCDSISVRKDIGEFSLDIKKTQTLGIIINELVSNILKYAFEGCREGEIELTGRCDGSHITIAVRDDGVGMPEHVSFRNSTGFGLMLVNALTDQLKGSIRIERGKGTRIVLEFDK
jgi:PAS domain S-box-containing protein